MPSAPLQRRLSQIDPQLRLGVGHEVIDGKLAVAMLQPKPRHDLNVREACAGKAFMKPARVHHPPATTIQVGRADESHHRKIGTGRNLERRRGDNTHTSCHRSEAFEGADRIAQVGGDGSGEDEVEPPSIKA